ncbi:MAG: helix-turn-helix domain-containing protein [Actinomycetota bacterium]|nr:helix-turn-helix domain-containing protein [Actinomycetota bacterium]
MSDSQPLFVRLPSPAAEQLNRIVKANGASKREIVTRLILGDGLAVGQHDFHPNPEPSVLTVSQAAELLQVGEQIVLALTETGALPGRRLGGQWRFSRTAVLKWLAAGQDADQAEGRR